jgi:nucleoside-diphosphate-sugar epimerase
MTLQDSARPVPVSTLAGRHLVVTGFTGFLAKVFVGLLLERAPDVGRVTLLVRPRGRLRPGRDRVSRILDTSPVFRGLRATHGPRLAAFLRDRLDVLDADIEKPGCGLSPAALEHLVDVDAVVHCAGLTDFEPDPAKALATNVAGTLHTAQLARRLGAPMVHVSTCYVAGNLGSDALVEEALTPGVSPNGTVFDPNVEVRALQTTCRTVTDPTDRVQAGLERARALGWPNIYTYTKGLAEHLLAKQPGLRWAIARPSIVECAREYPFPGWNEGLNTAGPLAWLISTAFRRFPTVPHHVFDVIPVDDVAKGLAAITSAVIEGRGDGVYQLGSSDHRPLTFDRAVELTGLGMRRWTRKGGGTATDRALLRLLDPIPVPADRPGPFAVDRVRRWVDRTRSLLGDLPREELPKPVDDAVGEWWAEARDRLLRRLHESDDALERVEKMLVMYRPFVHDNSWVFRTERARAVSANDPTFRFDASDIDWCTYWVDVEYPGLRRWCIPIIDGVKIEGDPPGTPPFHLAASPPFARAASVARVDA